MNTAAFPGVAGAFEMSPLLLAEKLRGRVVSLSRDGSVRRIGGDGHTDFAAFNRDENVTFPARVRREEGSFYQALFNEGKVAQIPLDAVSAAARLALDGVLMVECESKQLTGAAWAAFLLESVTPHAPLDRHALLLAGRLLYSAGPGLLAQGLYTAGRWPVTPSSMNAARRSLAVLNAMNCPAPWTRIPLSTTSAWIAWKRAGAMAGNPTGLPRVKLYVSVNPEFFETEHRFLLEVIFSAPETLEVKFASTAAGLHRADAFVVYSETHRHLAAMARKLALLLADAPPSGMTFAASFPETGNLFWGIDPLLPEHLAYGESWRRFLCNQCARFASRLWERSMVDPVAIAQAALFRLSLDGIDATHWIPPYASQAA